MSNPSVDAIYDGLDTMKRVLFSPFEWKKYMKLAIVFLLAGSSGGGGGGGGGGSRDSESGKGGGSLPDPGEALKGLFHGNDMMMTATLIIIGLLIAGLIFLLMYVSCVFQFIFLQCIVMNRVSIGEFWRNNAKRGLDYFMWMLGIAAAALIILSVVFVIPVILLIPQFQKHAVPVIGQIMLAILGLCLFLLFFLVLCFLVMMIKDLLVPLVLAKDTTFRKGWGLLIPLIKSNMIEILYFVLLKIGIRICVTVVALVALMACLIVCGLVFGLPAALVALAFHALHLAFSPLIITAGVLWAFLGLVSLVFMTTLLILPAGVFDYSYNMSFLGRLEPAFSLIPGRPQPVVP